MSLTSYLTQRLTFPNAHADRALLIEAMHDILGEIQQINLRLNDPTGDGSGRNSQPPDGDDFNELSAAIQCTVISALDTIGAARS